MVKATRKTSKVTARRKAKEGEEGKKETTFHKILTAEGWKRLMLGRGRKGSKAKH